MNRFVRTITLLLIALLVGVASTACGDSSTAGQLSPTSSSTTTVVPPASTATPIGPDRSVSANSAATETVTTASSQSTQAPDPQSTAASPMLPTPRPIESAPPPVRLRIPSLGIDTAVQWVGTDAEGRMSVPSNYTDVGWYERGPSPGTPGNAVIAGHLDSTSGPAVFYQLEDLNVGDEVITTTADGQEFRFLVTASEIYLADDVPADQIFGNAINPQLNLITCDGAFDHSIRQYDKRLVVYTQLATD